MRLLRRNTTLFSYMPFAGEAETMRDGMHTGVHVPVYGEAVTYRGNISIPSGMATEEMFGLNTRYTHVLLMDKPNTDIREGGIIVWHDDQYDVLAVRRSLNVLSAALKKRTAAYVPPDQGD